MRVIEQPVQPAALACPRHAQRRLGHARQPVWFVLGHAAGLTSASSDVRIVRNAACVFLPALVPTHTADLEASG